MITQRSAGYPERQGYQGSEEHDTHERHRTRKVPLGFGPDLSLCWPWRPPVSRASRDWRWNRSFASGL